MSCIIQGDEPEAFIPCGSFWTVFEKAPWAKKAALYRVICSRYNHFYHPQANQHAQPGRRVWRAEDLVQPVVAAGDDIAGPPEPAGEAAGVQAAEETQAVKAFRFILDLIQHLTIELRDLDLLLDDAASRLNPQGVDPNAPQTLVAHIAGFIGDVGAVDVLAGGVHRLAGAIDHRVDPAHPGNQGGARSGLWAGAFRIARGVSSPNNLADALGAYLSSSANVPEIRDSLSSVQQICGSIRRLATGGEAGVRGQLGVLQRAALEALNRERNLGPVDSPERATRATLRNIAEG